MSMSVMDERTDELIIKAVNHNAGARMLELELSEGWKAKGQAVSCTLAGEEGDYNSIDEPQKVALRKECTAFAGALELQPMSFTVVRISVERIVK